MARDLSCASGKKAYKTKRAAGEGAVRCDRCRWWHPPGRTRRGGGVRK
jgi:hypothetical protein